MKRKAIFDTLRKILGRGFRQSEVAAIDDVLDAAMADTCSSASAKRKSTKQLNPSSTCFELIKRFEGCASLRPDGLIEAYPDPGTGDAPWTIGWGATGAGIGPDTVWTQAECDARLTADIERHAAEVANALGNATTSQAEFDALVSFHYNTGAIHRATLTAKHRSGDRSGAIEEFARWNRAGGRVLKGLVRRRQAEARIYASQKA
ncbi:MAG: lysozyme [Altererythrobacter ishigakiensis]|nr:lysozyme [Altererythrobacter ishigakiensis]